VNRQPNALLKESDVVAEIRKSSLSDSEKQELIENLWRASMANIAPAMLYTLTKLPAASVIESWREILPGLGSRILRREFLVGLGVPDSVRGRFNRDRSRR
jgi:hypothetical protein